MPPPKCSHWCTCLQDFCTWCAALSVTAEVEEVEAKVTEAVEADEAAAVAQQPAGERLAAVAAVVEAEVEADDGPARQQVRCHPSLTLFLAAP